MIDYLQKFRLDNKIAVVCGGLGLLGKEVCIALAQAGAKVIVLDINREQGLLFLEECSRRTLSLKFRDFDITNLSLHKSFMESIEYEDGPIGVLVNTAYPRTEDWNNKLEDVKIDSWRVNVDSQMNSACILTREVAELMKKNRVHGSIINFGSTYGLVAPDFEIYANTDLTCPAAYATIKSGIIGFSRYAASYYGKDGIRINCLCPGGIFGGVIKDPKSIFTANYEKKTPLKRMGKPEEIAAAALFLASDASSYITGSSFMVDGGWTSI